MDRPLLPHARLRAASLFSWTTYPDCPLIFFLELEPLTISQGLTSHNSIGSGLYLNFTENANVSLGDKIPFGPQSSLAYKE